MPTFVAIVTAFFAAFFTSLKEGEIVAELLSVCRVTTRLSGNRQGEKVRMTVSALDVLTDRSGARMGRFLETLTKHLSAFPNLSEKWRQFHFTLAGQIRGPLANCCELYAKQLRSGVRSSRVIRFTNSG